MASGSKRNTVPGSAPVPSTASTVITVSQSRTHVIMSSDRHPTSNRSTFSGAS